MAQVLISEQYLNNIADAIRGKNGSSETYTPAQMAGAVNALYPEPSGTIAITQNGAVDVKSKASANVNVPNTYDASDNGKVVVNQALAPQTSKNITENGTHDTTANNRVVVEVPNSYAAADEGKVVSSGALVAQTSRNISLNGTYDTTLNDEVVVAVEGGGGGSTNILSGSEVPTSQDGTDGCIYLQTESGHTFSCDPEYNVSSTSQLLSTQSAAFYKTIEGSAIAVHYMWSNIYGPILISLNPDYVKMTQNTGTPYTVDVDGVTWYMSTVNYFSYDSDSPQIPTLYTVGLDPQNASNRPAIVRAILEASNAVVDEGALIKSAFCKVSGVWQNLIETNIDDVNMGG